ncbi:MAG: hypothetical protein HPY76_09875, partial [Anaerolineae bacterium]|nr:hypothetical protein [Anaerolineae bacterium]
SNTTVYVGQTLLVRGAATPTISPTTTNTARPPTRTARPSRTIEPTRATGTPTITSTPTRPPLLPQLPGLQSGSDSRRTFGYGLIAICGVGLLMVALSALRRKPPPQ